MWYLGILLLVSYGALTWRSVLEASSPLVRCQEQVEQPQHNPPCFRPAVHVGDRVGLVLELYQPVDAGNDDIKSNKRNKLFHWVPVETCRINVTVPPIGILPHLLTTGATAATNSSNNSNYNDSRNDASTSAVASGKNHSGATLSEDNSNVLCEIPIPNFARHRASEPDSVQPLQARFVIVDLYHPQQRRVVGTTGPFFLTRIKKREPASYGLGGLIPWKSGDGEAPVSRRNLLQDPLPHSKTTNSTSSIPTSNTTITTGKDIDGEREQRTTMWIPFLKFGRAPVRIRFVAEDRGYALLRRADGIALHAVNNSHYGPMVYVDEMSLQRSAQVELAPPHETKPPFKLQIKFGSISPMVDSVLRQLAVALETAEQFLPGDGGGQELDELRYFLQDERLYRFALTQIISYVHMWLDYLAFRDEIRFYRGRRNLSGVSASTVMTRLACSAIILLYLLDGGGTSWVVLLSLFCSCAVEAWKVWKLLRPTLSTRFPFLSISNSQTSQERETAEYDRIAFRYLAMVLYPLVLAWSLYALKEYEYKSWYSWLISNLANAVYTFGFIALCPQLYVNYRLKSVAHLPWKVFMYKIFNTFVDDAFAWLIEMPLKHRIMTLRDDVVFIIFLLQVYIYRVDKSRTNEFGYSYEDGSHDDGNNTNSGSGNSFGSSIACVPTGKDTTADEHGEKLKFE